MEVAKVLLDDQAESTAAVEVRCLARTGCSGFDVDGNMIEEWKGIQTRTRIRMREDCEGTWKRKRRT